MPFALAAALPATLRRQLPAAVLGLFVLVGALRAQDSRPGTAPTSRAASGPQTRVRAHVDEGKIVRDIKVEGARYTSADQILQLLRTRVGAPLRRVDIDDDLRALWLDRRIRATFETGDADGGVRVFLRIEEHPTYEKIEWRGLDHFTEQQVNSILGITSTLGMNALAARNHALALEERYRRDGYYFVKIRIEEDEKRSRLVFLVDEGAKVKVGAVHFRGNASYPGEPFLFQQSLVDSADLKSKTNFLFPNEPYSERVVEDDLERLRLFYRRHGYRDALVELAERKFNADMDRVELTFLVLEGRRYRVSSVEIEQEPPEGRDQPLYPKQDLFAVVKTKPGEFYDRDRIQRDLLAIAEYYGKRGHPRRNLYGRNLPSAFDTKEPLEVFDIEKAEVKLVYQIVEGTPKKLRDVKIRGNLHTKDRVIRRKIYAEPGTTLDFTKVDKSQQLLDETQYFNDERGLAGVRFELQPVEGDPDTVDLAVDVTEGNTGQFLWGAGVSTGLGFVGRIELLKRNFDIGKTPSSWDPITLFSELVNEKAFSGGGQTLDLVLAPGTKLSTFSLSFLEPDLFQQHQDTIGLRTRGYRRIQYFEAYRTDELGAAVGLERNFTEDFSLRFTVRDSNTTVKGLAPFAPSLAWDARGSTELRSLQLQANFRDVDRRIQPTKGIEGSSYVELFGGLLGTGQDFWKAGIEGTAYAPLWVDDRQRAHVVKFRSSFDYGKAYGDTRNVFLTERFYMGAANLRGFNYRGAGPTQFAYPVGGEARLLAGLEYGFPVLSVPVEGRLRENEVLRGHLFSDFGLLGLTLDDRTFQEPRLSVGFGVRLLIPMLGLPIELDLAWPILFEETDHRRAFYFSISR